MAYYATCRDGPEDRRNVAIEWGDRDGAPFVRSCQVWEESRLIGRPAVLAMPVGRGHVVAFNLNPLHRNLNRGDHRIVWNASLNWQAILAAKPPDGLASETN
jgi:hypothetical protein